MVSKSDPIDGVLDRLMEKIRGIGEGEASQTIMEFCRSERISRAQFYVMRKGGWGPRLMKVGNSVRVSPEARRDWRREREAAAARGVERKVV